MDRQYVCRTGPDCCTLCVGVYCLHCRQISQLRGCRQLLLPDEWCGYTEVSRQLTVSQSVTDSAWQARAGGTLAAS